MVKLICTPFHTGKSEYIYSEIVKKLNEGKKVILMVPEQEALIAEARLCTLLSGKNSLNLEVLNFKRLCNRVFREYGGLCYNYVGKGGQAVLLWRVLSSLSGTLRQIRVGNSPDESLISELLSLFKTFKSYGITDTMLEKAGECAKGSFCDKLGDVTAIYSAYQSVLSEKFDDANDDLDRLYDTLCSNDFFSGKCVFFDSFYDFTAKELSVIEKVMESAAECTFSIEYLNEADGENYLRPLGMKKQLTSLCFKITGEMPEFVFDSFSDECEAPIRYAFTNLWDYSKTEYGKAQNAIHIYSESDKYGEAMRCANLCAALVREGARYRDIAVISRNMSDYEGIIDTYLVSKDIPCHISKRNRLFVQPAIRVLFSALEIVAHNFKCEDIISYMKTGYTGLSKEKVGLLASYIRLWNIRGKRRYDDVWNMNPKDHTDTMPDNEGEILCEINEAREVLVNPLIELSQELSSSKTAKDTANAIYGFLCGIGLDDKLNNSRDYIVWNTLIGILEQYADCACDDANAETVMRLLKMIVNATDIGNIPKRNDEVTLGNANMIRLSGIKHIIILGANDGVFPKTVKDDSFFHENEIAVLKEYGIEMPDNLDKRIDDEKFFFARALSFATCSVDIIYSGKKSEAAARISDMFPDAEIINTDISDEIFTENDALLQSVLTDNMVVKATLDKIVGDKREQIDECDISFVSAENIKELYKGDINLTKSRIESIAACPLKYRLGYDLSLHPMTKSNVNQMETGTFLHALFERGLRKIFADGKMTVGESEFVGIIEDEAKAYIKKGFGSQENVSPTVYALFCDLTNTAGKIASSMYREFKNSNYIPTLFESGVGTRETDTVSPYYVRYDEHRKAFVYGVCDRIDVLKSGDNAYLRVIDYKSGNEIFNSKELEEGKSMQLPLYLFSFCKTDSEKIKKTLGVKGEILPGGFMYYMITDPNVNIESDEIRGIIDSNDTSYIDKYIHASGVTLDDKVLKKDFEKSIYNTKGIAEISGGELDEYEVKVQAGVCKICDTLLSGDASKSLYPNKTYCDRCEYRAVCRRGDN